MEALDTALTADEGRRRRRVAPGFPIPIVGALFNGCLWAMLLTLGLSRWTWLEMRLNMGWVFYGAWGVLFLVALRHARKATGPGNAGPGSPFARGMQSFGFSAVNAVICAALCVALCDGPAGAQTLPACLVREGLGQTTWSIASVNGGMAAFSAACLAALAVPGLAHRTDAGRPPGKGGDKAQAPCCRVVQCKREREEAP